MLDNALHDFANGQVLRRATLGQVGSEAILLHGCKDISHILGNVHPDLLIGVVRGHAEERVHGEEDERLAAGQPAVLDGAVLRVRRQTPAVNAGYVTDPDGAGDVGVIHVFEEMENELSKVLKNGLGVRESGRFVALFVAHHGSDDAAVHGSGLHVEHDKSVKKNFCRARKKVGYLPKSQNR